MTVPCKIFFSSLAKRYVDKIFGTSAQKGTICEFSGCFEHTSILSKMESREKRADRADLTVVWLNLANAIGTIPHIGREGIGPFMELYVFPQGLITAYQSLETGIVEGCIMSSILFLMGMNIPRKEAEREKQEYPD